MSSSKGVNQQMFLWSKLFHVIRRYRPHSEQCDQIIRLFFQYLAIYSDENLPKGVQIVP